MLSGDTVRVIVFIFIPVFICILGYYLYANLFKKKNIPNQEQHKRKNKTETSSNPVITFRLQAYEKIVLFVERVYISSLLERVDISKITSKDLPFLLVKIIREEFDYNITQQIYISHNLWKHVETYKEQTINDILFMAEIVEIDKVEINAFIKNILNYFDAKTKHATLKHYLLKALQEEAKSLM